MNEINLLNSLKVAWLLKLHQFDMLQLYSLNETAEDGNETFMSRSDCAGEL